MKEADIRNRIGSLLVSAQNPKKASKSNELLFGTLTIMNIVYGPNNPQAEKLSKETEYIRKRYSDDYASENIAELAESILRNIKGELESGILGSIQRTLTGEVLTDFLQLARTALEEKGDEAKNIAAVLSAALFEDTIRRLATTNGIPHFEKLQDIITELKNKGILNGSQIGIANSYLNFRNNSLHAQWDKVGRESVASVLAFVEQLLLAHFS
jgi:hypothetical protein